MATSAQAVKDLSSAERDERRILGRSLADACKFPRARWDMVTGPDCHEVRWYEPNTGGWGSRDPAGFAMGDVNLYRFVGNGPTDGVDPSGLQGQGSLGNVVGG